MFDEEIEGYKLEKELGKGSFSRVLLATKLNTGEKCAVKKLTKVTLVIKDLKNI